MIFMCHRLIRMFSFLFCISNNDCQGQVSNALLLNEENDEKQQQTSNTTHEFLLSLSSWENMLEWETAENVKLPMIH